MIRFAEEKDRAQIVELWQLVFGDERQGINNYLDKYLSCVLLYTEEGKTAGMLSLLPLKCNGTDGKYVYAVATHPAFRSRGIAAELIKYSERENFLLLVPAEKSLFDYYAKLGFKEICSVEKKEFYACGLEAAEEIPVKIKSDELYSLRKKAFGQYDFFEWSAEELKTVSDMYNGHIYKGIGFFAVCDVQENEVFVKELYAENVFNAVCALNNLLKKEKYTVILKNENIHPFAMIKGREMINPYFNLAMD